MGNYQTGYGHGDVVGVPFDFYVGAAALPAGVNIQMQSGVLVIDPAAAVSGVVTLPLNPGDGAVAEISNVTVAGGFTFTFTGGLLPATGDAILGTALASLAAGVTARYRYTLNGYSPNVNVVPVNPRTWVRVA